MAPAGGSKWEQTAQELYPHANPMNSDDWRWLPAPPTAPAEVCNAGGEETENRRMVAIRRVLFSQTWHDHSDDMMRYSASTTVQLPETLQPLAATLDALEDMEHGVGQVDGQGGGLLLST